MGAENQVGIGLSYRPASLCSLATQFQTRFLESIPRPIAGLKFSTQESWGWRGGGGPQFGRGDRNYGTLGINVLCGWDYLQCPICFFFRRIFVFSTFFFFSSGATFQFSGKDARTGKIVEVKRDGVIPISGAYDQGWGSVVILYLSGCGVRRPKNAAISRKIWNRSWLL